jgi:FtsZ-binding cell division protein ZapB
LSEVDSNLQTKYQKALGQIQSMHKDNSEMKTQATTLKSDIQTWRAKFEALERSKNNELQELRMTFENQTKSVFQK